MFRAALQEAAVFKDATFLELALSVEHTVLKFTVFRECRTGIKCFTFVYLLKRHREKPK